MRATDWDRYYRNPASTTRFTRPITYGAVQRAMLRFGAARPSIVELGGAASQVFAFIRDAVQPSEYNVVDTNAYGLGLLRETAGVSLHHCDARTLDLGHLVDVAFSLGLIEHFEPAGTREVILAHLRLVKPGGIAIITFPTPTLLYRLTRGFLELIGKWIFHDERPLRAKEVRAAVEGEGAIVHEELIWKIMLTQRLVVIRRQADRG